MESFTPDPQNWSRFMTALAERVGQDFVTASDHPGSCRCGLCLQWWVRMGNEEEGYGPFGEAEIAAAREVQDAEQVSSEVSDS